MAGLRRFTSKYLHTSEVRALGPDVHLRLTGAGESHLYSPDTAREIAKALIEAAEEAAVPPVVTFRQGDTVRYKSEPQYVFSIGRNGYFDHTNGIWIANGNTGAFTSQSYERVELGADSL